jgi:hypothetical protein
MINGKRGYVENKQSRICDLSSYTWDKNDDLLNSTSKQQHVIKKIAPKILHDMPDQVFATSNTTIGCKKLQKRTINQNNAYQDTDFIDASYTVGSYKSLAKLMKDNTLRKNQKHDTTMADTKDNTDIKNAIGFIHRDISKNRKTTTKDNFSSHHVNEDVPMYKIRLSVDQNANRGTAIRNHHQACDIEVASEVYKRANNKINTSQDKTTQDNFVIQVDDKIVSSKSKLNKQLSVNRRKTEIEAGGDNKYNIATKGQYKKIKLGNANTNYETDMSNSKLVVSGKLSHKQQTSIDQNPDSYDGKHGDDMHFDGRNVASLQDYHKIKDKVLNEGLNSVEDASSVRRKNKFHIRKSDNVYNDSSNIMDSKQSEIDDN